MTLKDRKFDPKQAGADRTLASAELVIVPSDRAASSERYFRLGELGRGGMGRVDAVFDRVLGRDVAQKEALDRATDALLVTEAQICAQLEHPSIVPVYDLTTGDDGAARYTMRVVKGRGFGEILAEPERPALAQLLGVLRQVCLAIEYAHSRGVVHRDLKPDNILVGSYGEVYVLDWGVAYVLPGSDLQRAEGLVQIAVAGTPQYMAPEQIEGKNAPAGDVFALGAIFFEVLVGARAFRDCADVRSVPARRPPPPPSWVVGRRKAPQAFDDLVGACLALDPAERPTAGRIAEAIDAFLDGERERIEREKEATALCAEGEARTAEHEELDGKARALDEEANALLSRLAPHDPFEKKREGWVVAERAAKLRADAARALAQAEIAFSSALGRVRDHAAARRGLAELHLAQMLEAERSGDTDRMAKHLEVARSYDDGSLATELSARGELEVLTDIEGARVELYRYERSGPLRVAAEPRSLGNAPVSPQSLAIGSYVVVARTDTVAVRYPVQVGRGRRHRVSLRLAAAEGLPESMVLIPGGPFLASATGDTLQVCHLGDFAIARFPITIGQYAEWLDSLGEGATERHVPHDGVAPLLRLEAGKWQVTETTVDGPAKAWIPAGRERDLPVYGVTWFDAVAYAKWRAERDGLSYRLPTALEWEKAMRGADGRPFPMGDRLDPSFAKIRQSRAEGPVVEPVGTFALDESPYGVRDMGGGVADWTATLTDDEIPPTSGRDSDPVAEQRHAYWMGGHWGSMGAQQAASRIPMGVRYRSNGVGFRLALSLGNEASSKLETELLRAAP